MSEDTEEMLQSRNTDIQRHQKKERGGKHNNKTNAIYETTETLGPDHNVRKDLLNTTIRQRIGKINMSEDTEEMLQSRNTDIQRHQKKERGGKHNNKTNATYETTETQTKNNCNKGIALGRSSGNYWGKHEKAAPQAATVNQHESLPYYGQ